MPRAKRAAAIAGEAKRTGVDPGYDSGDVGFECYLDKDASGDKFPCRVKAEGSGYYRAIFIQQNSDGQWVEDGDETPGVHFNPDHGPGHGIWRRDERCVERQVAHAVNSTVAAVQASPVVKIPAATKTPPAAKTPRTKQKQKTPYQIVKAAGRLPSKRALQTALRERGLDDSGDRKKLFERLDGWSKCTRCLNDC